MWVVLFPVLDELSRLFQIVGGSVDMALNRLFTTGVDEAGSIVFVEQATGVLDPSFELA